MIIGITKNLKQNDSNDASFGSPKAFDAEQDLLWTSDEPNTSRENGIIV